MRNIIVKTENLTALHDAYFDVMDVAGDDPRMLVVHGFAGAGKTTAIRKVALENGDLFLRCSCTWTPTALLSAIAAELRLEGGRSRSARLNGIKTAMEANPRAVFLDDADQLFNVGTNRESLILFETLREIHDEAQVAIVFTGQENFSSRLRQWEQLARRVVESIEFQPLSLEDAQAIAQQRAEVAIDPELVRKLHTESGGSCGRITNGIRAVENFAKKLGLDSVLLKDWEASGRKFYLDLVRMK